MQASNGSIIASVIICAAILLIAQVLMTPDISEIEMPTNEGIATAVLAGVDIPTAQDIADKIDIPEAKDTFLGVKSEKKVIAEELALDELNDDDLIEKLAGILSSKCGDIDIEDEDITNIKVLDTDFSGFNINHNDKTGTTLLELKVYFDNDGDDEEQGTAKVLIKFYIVNLDYNDNYEDAEVNDYDIIFDKAYGDLVC